MAELTATLIKGDRVSSKTDYRDALPINMIAIPRPILGANGYMRAWPGLSLHATGKGIDRGGVYNERVEQHFRVSGTSLIKVNTDGTITVLGSIGGTSQVSLPYSFNTQAVVADGKAYLYDATNGFRRITDPDLKSPLDCVWIDGYYFFTDGEYIYHTDISDESSIDPLKYSTASFMPDPSLAVAKTQDNKVLVFGRYSLEYFVNQATQDFAFTRIETRSQKIGIVATHAKCELNGVFYITGGRKEEALGVHAIGIGSATKISTREIDKVLKQYTEPELINMRMESRLEDDMELITIHLPNETLCFNVTAAKALGKEYAWSQLRTGSSTVSYRAINGIFDANLGYWIFGDKYNHNIGQLAYDSFGQYDEASEWELYTPFLNLERMSINEMELEIIPGFTIFDDAKLAFSITYDGVTYSSEWWDIYGLKDEYTMRYIVRRLGDISSWAGFKFRAVTKSRMAFGAIRLIYG